MKALEDFASLVTVMVGPRLHLPDCPVLVDEDARCTGTCAEVHRVMGEWRVDVERALLRAEES